MGCWAELVTARLSAPPTPDTKSRFYRAGETSRLGQTTGCVARSGKNYCVVAFTCLTTGWVFEFTFHIGASCMFPDQNYGVCLLVKVTACSIELLISSVEKSII